MTLADLTKHAGEWLRPTGPAHDVIISSRARLARNLAGTPFLPKCSPVQRQEIEARLRQEVLESGLSDKTFYVDVAAAGELDRRLLVERHLISRQHADAAHPRGVAVTSDETIAIMVNEEDHLRIQVLRSGLGLADAVDTINRVDDLLEKRLEYAFHPRYGYLTACPTNVGTGLRVSVMLHLPAVKMTGELDKLFRAAHDMHLAVRGLYGEGTEASGDFFQLSNQTTLAKTESQITTEFLEQMLPQFVEYERHARAALADKQPDALDDKIFRAMAILRAARMMNSEETLYLLSLVRLGVNMKRLPQIDIQTVNELLLWTQPAHLQRMLNRPMDGKQRDAARADYIRQRLGAD